MSAGLSFVESSDSLSASESRHSVPTTNFVPTRTTRLRLIFLITCASTHPTPNTWRIVGA
ncbi:MAG: hypothetical protein ACJA2W_001271 [Planctomycetota bacterium]|jgi:hypothetical protein